MQGKVGDLIEHIENRQIMNITEEIYQILLENYGPRGWWPVTEPKGLKPVYDPKLKLREKTDREKFEICAGAILAQSTNWKNVEKAIANMKLNKSLTREAISQTSLEELAELIKPAGYYNQKAKKLKAFVSFEGRITREGLLGIWGLGPETVDSILLYAYDKPNFVVDTYTKRIFSRLGLCSLDDNYNTIQNIFTTRLEKNPAIFNEYHALIVEHAKQHCRKDPICEGCRLAKFCKSNNL